MKIYALIHGVCGIAEGYSETECHFYKDRATAIKHQSQWLSTYTEMPHEEVILGDNLNEIIIVRNDDEGDHVILHIAELSPMWDTGRDADNVTTEWFCWNQMDNEDIYGDESFKNGYLPTDMGLIQQSMEWLGKDSTIDLEMYQEFVSGVYFRSHTFIDADDVAIHCFRLPKFNGGMTTNTKQREVTISQDNDFNEAHEQHKQFAK